ncbi:MAG: flagellar export chaperone FliS [Deltaproteobacteria bacterium]|nr:flagellar export chaperone FliS [Deltaproteobacteria bacterium]MBW1929091.1 flagellar export chaperone FliS [Deltaproteobacteria bacterium]
MIYGKKVSQYQKTNVETASGVELVVMCYEHAVRFLKEAKDHYDKRNYPEKAKALQKALDIINELKCNLDFEKGGEIASNLDSIYNYLIRILLQGDIERRLETFDQAVHILEELKEAWENISLQVAREEENRSASISEAGGKTMALHASVAA